MSIQNIEGKFGKIKMTIKHFYIEKTMFISEKYVILKSILDTMNLFVECIYK